MYDACLHYDFAISLQDVRLIHKLSVVILVMCAATRAVMTAYQCLCMCSYQHEVLMHEWYSIQQALILIHLTSLGKRVVLCVSVQRLIPALIHLGRVLL